MVASGLLVVLNSTKPSWFRCSIYSLALSGNFNPSRGISSLSITPGLDALLHEDARQKARPIFITGDDERRHSDAPHFLDQRIKRRPLLLHALLRVGRSDG